MAHSMVRAAVRSVLGVSWNGLAVLDANSGNEVPTDGSPFIIVQFPVSTTTRPFVDQPPYREEGGCRILIHVQAGSGEDQAMSWADDIAGLFRDQRIEGVNFKVPSSPRLDNGNDLASYYQVAVVVPYDLYFMD